MEAKKSSEQTRNTPPPIQIEKIGWGEFKFTAPIGWRFDPRWRPQQELGSPFPLGIQKEGNRQFVTLFAPTEANARYKAGLLHNALLWDEAKNLREIESMDTERWQRQVPKASADTAFQQQESIVGKPSSDNMEDMTISRGGEWHKQDPISADNTRLDVSFDDAAFPNGGEVSSGQTRDQDPLERSSDDLLRHADDAEAAARALASAPEGETDEQRSQRERARQSLLDAARDLRAHAQRNGTVQHAPHDTGDRADASPVDSRFVITPEQQAAAVRSAENFRRRIAHVDTLIQKADEEHAALLADLQQASTDSKRKKVQSQVRRKEKEIHGLKQGREALEREVARMEAIARGEISSVQAQGEEQSGGDPTDVVVEEEGNSQEAAANSEDTAATNETAENPANNEALERRIAEFEAQLRAAEEEIAQLNQRIDALQNERQKGCLEKFVDTWKSIPWYYKVVTGVGLGVISATMPAAAPAAIAGLFALRVASSATIGVGVRDWREDVLKKKKEAGNLSGWDDEDVRVRANQWGWGAAIASFFAFSALSSYWHGDSASPADIDTTADVEQSFDYLRAQVAMLEGDPDPDVQALVGEMHNELNQGSVLFADGLQQGDVPQAEKIMESVGAKLDDIYATNLKEDLPFFQHDFATDGLTQHPNPDVRDLALDAQKALADAQYFMESGDTHMAHAAFEHAYAVHAAAERIAEGGMPPFSGGGAAEMFMHTAYTPELASSAYPDLFHMVEAGENGLDEMMKTHVFQNNSVFTEGLSRVFEGEVVPMNADIREGLIGAIRDTVAGNPEFVNLLADNAVVSGGDITVYANDSVWHLGGAFENGAFRAALAETMVERYPSTIGDYFGGEPESIQRALGVIGEAYHDARVNA